MNVNYENDQFESLSFSISQFGIQMISKLSFLENEISFWFFVIE